MQTLPNGVWNGDETVTNVGTFENFHQGILKKGEQKQRNRKTTDW